MNLSNDVVAQSVPPPAAPKKNYTPEEAKGLGLGWVDQYNPNYGKAGFVGSEAPAAPGATARPGLDAPTGGTPAPQTTAQALTGAGTVGATPQQGAPATVAGAFQQAMLNNLAPAPVTADSASVAPQIQANQLTQQRASERLRAQNAERNAATGANMSGGANTEQIGLEQDRAAQEGGFNAGAIAGQQDKDRQAQLMMSQLAGGLLQGNDAQALSKYGIDTGAATSKYGVDASTQLGQGDLALRSQLGKGQLNLGLAGLLQNGDQFGQNLSSENARYSSGLNQQALLSLLGGL